MQNICLYFQVHQPFRTSLFRFFDVGTEKEYFDNETNKNIINKVAENCYLPANKLILKLIKKYGDKFKLSFSISGTALDQFEQYAPRVLDSFKKIAKTGNVEFLAETYNHSLISLKNKNDFIEQVNAHVKKIKKIFGQSPRVFRNTELIYNNNIGKTVSEMGFKAMITEGADRVLDWRSPNFLYYNVLAKDLKLLLKNYKLSDDIAFRFSDKNWEQYPLTAKKYVNWIKNIDSSDDIVNLFFDYETFGEHHSRETGIFDFLKNFPEEVIKNSNFEFITPSEATKNIQPIAPLNVEDTISWADSERDLSAWLGNDLQDEAYSKLYELSDKIRHIDDLRISRDWKYLQSSDHFYYMCLKGFADGLVHNYFNHFKSPFEAFINYMNILSDFKLRVNNLYEKSKSSVIDEEILKQIERLRRKLYQNKKIRKREEKIKAEMPEIPIVSLSN